MERREKGRERKEENHLSRTLEQWRGAYVALKQCIRGAQTEAQFGTLTVARWQKAYSPHFLGYARL